MPNYFQNLSFSQVDEGDTINFKTSNSDYVFAVISHIHEERDGLAVGLWGLRGIMSGGSLGLVAKEGALIGNKSDYYNCGIKVGDKISFLFNNLLFKSSSIKEIELCKKR